eukprot:Hpha_TRINITY_DN7518_c0_g1::TRINITY_DN7518_c0_g1_i1::g.19157::m.19157
MTKEDQIEDPSPGEEERHSSPATRRARYLALGAALLASGSTGCTYTFGVYSGGLKHKFDLSQTQIDTIGQITFLGGIFTFLTGMVNDRLGPRITCAMGGCLLTIIEVLYWLVARGYIDCNGKADVALATLGPFIQIFTGFVVAAVFTTLVRNFPRKRGAIVGLGKGWVGLFGGASTQVFSGLFFVPDKDDPKSVDYVLFCAVMIFCLTVPPAAFLMVVPKDSDEEARREEWLLRRRLTLGFSVVVFTAGIVALAAILKSSLGSGGHLVIAIAVLVLWFIIAPLVNIPAKLACPPAGGQGYEVVASNDDEEGEDKPPIARKERQRIQSGGHTSRRSNASASLSVSEADHYSGKGENNDDAAEVGPELNTLQMVQTADCWLLYLVATITIGGGEMLTTNLGQICDSTGYGSSSSAISLFSVGQALSRMASGLLADHLLISYGVHRPLFLLAAPGFMALGHTVLLLASNDVTLYIGVLISGIGFGAIWPLTVVLVSELFGRRNLGGNYMLFDGWCAALGSLGLAKFLPQSIYNSHKDPSTPAPPPVPWDGSGSSSGPDCTGRDCFGASFGVIAGLSYLALILVLVLAARNRKLYRNLIAYHRQCAGGESDSD